MTLKEINIKLNNMNGRTFTYANTTHTIKSFTINEEKELFTLNTDKITFKKKFASAKEFFRFWYEAKENIVIDKAMAVSKRDSLQPAPNVVRVIDPFASTDMDLNDQMIAILQDNIRKVQSNPQYLKQAQAVDKGIGSIIAVQRLKLDTARFTKSNSKPEKEIDSKKKA